MARQRMSSEGSYGRQMLEDALEAIKGFDRAMRGHNGNDGILTRLSHVERTAKENRERLGEQIAAVRAEVLTIKNDLDMIRHPDKADDEVAQKKWAAIGQWASPFGIVLALLLSLLNTLGVIGP